MLLKLFHRLRQVRYLYSVIIHFRIPNPLHLIYRTWYRQSGYKKHYPIEKARAFLDRGEWAVYDLSTGEQSTVGMLLDEALDYRETFYRRLED